MKMTLIPGAVVCRKALSLNRLSIKKYDVEEGITLCSNVGYVFRSPTMGGRAIAIPGIMAGQVAYKEPSK